VCYTQYTQNDGINEVINLIKNISRRSVGIVSRTKLLIVLKHLMSLIRTRRLRCKRALAVVRADPDKYMYVEQKIVSVC